MRICHVIDIPLFGLGGAESVAQDQIEACQRDGLENVIIQFASPDAPPRPESFDANIPIFRHDPAAAFNVSWHPKDANRVSNVGRMILGSIDPAGERQLEELIQRLQPSVIIYNCVNAPGYLRPLSRFGVPVIVRFAGYIFMCPRGGLVHRTGDVCLGPPLSCKLRNLALWKATPRPTLILAQSNFLRRLLIEQGFASSSVSLLGNPVYVPEAIPIRTGWNKSLIYAGRLEQYKGVIDAIDAVCAAHDPDIKLVVCGDGPLRNEVQDRADASCGKIVYLGRVPRARLTQIYTQVDAAIVPSRTPETFCLSAYEAMAFGLPVLGTQLGALGEVVINGQTGFTFPTGNIAELTRCINTLYESWSSYLPLCKQARRGAEVHARSRVDQAFCRFVRSLTGEPS